MYSKKRRTPLIVLLCFLCVVLAGLGWYVVDTNWDRSGWVEKDGIYSYRDFHGRKITGWLEVDGWKYYFREDASMATGWLELDGSTYHLGTDGTLDLGWIAEGEDRYYSGSDGSIRTGWQDIDFQRYFFADSGKLCTGWLEQTEGTYHLGADGAMSLGFVTVEDSTYYFAEDGRMHTGPLVLGEDSYLFTQDGTQYTGWLEDEDSARYYDPQTGILLTGWQQIDGSLYYLGEDGLRQTGWLELGEYRYYLHPDGTAAVGPTEIDGSTYYFTPKGIHVVLVNTRNKVPGYYKMELVTVQDWHRVSSVCLEPLKRMLADCKAAGISYTFNSAYRSIAEQQEILSKRTQEYEEQGMDGNAAYAKARQTVALPGTSEHHLGLAVDLLGQEAIQWLGRHCWEYGFILRYTADKEHITGFVDEPWHFRYVGTEVSLELKDSGLCLEEYLGAWTETDE